ncbi:hypothetical protein GO299_04706 [Ralstonia solanacearum]|nr:hypothetical protein [Ralstonia solanacearum]NKF72419.1 hypothetical protein [Ralstonia solanacearum]
MSKSKELKQQLEAARTYTGKIGRAEPHFRNGSVGRLHLLSVSTKIAHQESTGAQNYWEDAKFDCALAAVVSKRFAELAAEALALMEDNYKQQFISEKSELLAKLAEIEALESAA